MAKFAKRIILALFVLILAASLAVMCLTLEAQAVAPHKYVVVFVFKAKPLNEPADPDIRIYVLVTAKTEGEAAIVAHKSLAEKLTAQATDRLEFLEAARKD